jgi:acyl-CoA synthetase (AMP-forming)/AMP-acid ligase II
VYETSATLRAIFQRVELAAALMQRYGVCPGDRVAIAMRNYPEWIVAYFAATAIGAVAVGINAWWTTAELDYGLRDSGARVLLADRERLERAAPLLGELAPLGLRVVAVRTEAADLFAGVERWDDVLAAYAGAALPDVDVDPDSDAMILYTSGTTAHPKGVGPHRAIMQSLFAFACARSRCRWRAAAPPSSSP